MINESYIVDLFILTYRYKLFNKYWDKAFESSQNSSGSMGLIDWTMRGPGPILEDLHYLIYFYI